MQIEISKTDYKAMMLSIDKAVSIIRERNTSPREYNVARRLYLIKRQIEKRNGKA